jgi:hypothetical protein
MNLAPRSPLRLETGRIVARDSGLRLVMATRARGSVSTERNA